MPKTFITQQRLAALIKKRSQYEALSAEISRLETEMKEQLKAGGVVRPGLLSARVREWERRTVAWKQVLIREKGEEFAERVFNATKPDKFETLVVEVA
jgi:hypothetical protein